MLDEEQVRGFLDLVRHDLRKLKKDMATRQSGFGEVRREFQLTELEAQEFTLLHVLEEIGDE